MWHDLVTYGRAHQHQPGFPPVGYTQAQLKWVLALTPDGTPKPGHLQPAGATSKGASLYLPRPTRSSSTVVPGLAYDRADYLLPGLPTKHAAYRDLLERFCRAYPDNPYGQALTAFLNSNHTTSVVRNTKRRNKEFPAGDSVTIQLVGRESYFTEDPDAQAFWEAISRDRATTDKATVRDRATTADTDDDADTRRRASVGVAEARVCVVCGEVAADIVRQSPFSLPVAMVRGAHTSGVTIFSATLETAGSNELTDTAAVCFPCAAIIPRTLQYLLHRDSPQRHATATTVTTWWSDPTRAAPTTEHDATTLLDLILNGGKDAMAAITDLLDQRARRAVTAETQAARIITASRRLRLQPPVHDAPLNIATLTTGGEGKRLIVSSHRQMMLSQLQDHVVAWHHDTLTLAHQIAPHQARFIPTWEMNHGLYPDSILDSKTPTSKATLSRTQIQLENTVLTAAPPPHHLFQAALHRMVLDDSPTPHRHTSARLNLISLYLTRKGVPVPDPHNPTPAFQCGRLLALAESAQYYSLARKPPKATLATRYLRKMLQSPNRTLARLGAVVEPHFASQRTPQGATWVEHQWNAIFTDLTSVPDTLTPTGKAEVLAGLYHQRAQRLTKPAPSNTDTDNTEEN